MASYEARVSDRGEYGMNDRQFELLCIHLDKIVDQIAELKVDIMCLKIPLSDSPPERRIE